MRTTSSSGRKQRKALYNQPWHQRRKKMGVHLDSKLFERYHIRSIPVRKGDTVKVVRGGADVRGHEAKVAVIDITNMKIVVEGLTRAKADNKQKQKWVDPSNVIITRLDLSDPKRRKRIEKRGKLAEGAVKEEPEEKSKTADKKESKSSSDGKENDESTDNDNETKKIEVDVEEEDENPEKKDE